VTDKYALVEQFTAGGEVLPIRPETRTDRSTGGAESRVRRVARQVLLRLVKHHADVDTSGSASAAESRPGAPTGRAAT
jgi:hypothetical protein